MFVKQKLESNLFLICLIKYYRYLTKLTDYQLCLMNDKDLECFDWNLNNSDLESDEENKSCYEFEIEENQKEWDDFRIYSGFKVFISVNLMKVGYRS